MAQTVTKKGRQDSDAIVLKMRESLTGLSENTTI